MEFAGVRLKIGRAERHIAELDAAMKTALGQDRYTIDSDREPETGDYVYRVHDLPKLDPEWPLVVGEILFDLRSALDHFAWQLVRLDGGKPGEQTHFPIHDTPTDKKGKPRSIMRPPVNDPQILAALKKVQPYERMGGHAPLDMHPLRRLRLMNNWDKHRLLLLTVQVLDLGRVSWGANEGDPDTTWEFPGKPLYECSPVARFNFGGADRPPHFKPNLALKVAVIEPLDARGFSVRLVGLSDLLMELRWGVAQYAIADGFLHLLSVSQGAALFPSDLAPHIIGTDA
jgi:hypothetical protein